MDLREWDWLPNSSISSVKKLLTDTDERCNILYSRTAYGADKKWMSSKETKIFKYPCIHSTPKNGVRYMYSNTDSNGFFGVPKVIFGESGINNPIIDLEGKFGITHGAMAISVSNAKDAKKMSEYLTSKKFESVLQSCLFSSYRIDWNLFTNFKKEFWN